MNNPYEEKIRLWLQHPPRPRFPKPMNLPPFKKQSFRSYAEMNAWKRQYLLRIAEQGGLTWSF